MKSKEVNAYQHCKTLFKGCPRTDREGEVVPLDEVQRPVGRADDFYDS
jgi:hypothetical protein